MRVFGFRVVGWAEVSFRRVELKPMHQYHKRHSCWIVWYVGILRVQRFLEILTKRMPGLWEFAPRYLAYTA